MNQTALKARIMNDKEFFGRVFTKVPARKVLATVQAKYPEAREYSPAARRITFNSLNNPGWFYWLDFERGELKCTAVYVPSKEDDE